MVQELALVTITLSLKLISSIRRSVLGEDLPFLFSLAVAAPTNTARAKPEPSQQAIEAYLALHRSVLD